MPTHRAHISELMSAVIQTTAQLTTTKHNRRQLYLTTTGQVSLLKLCSTLVVEILTL